MKRILYLLFNILCMCAIVHAQTQQPYILNGDATQKSCNCYQLTPATSFASGTVWNKNKIDLTQSFNYVFDVNLGCDASGADGIAFMLQTKGTNLGASGQGIGFKGISPSLGIIIDTYQNQDENDPSYDHLAIQMNGLTDHLGAGNLAGPVQVIDGVNNIKDCAWHLMRIQWNAASFTLDVSIDNVVRLSIQKDLVHDIFSDDPTVYWGFAGSTGGQTNVQQFCAALRPAFGFDATQKLCYGEPVQFNNSSSSFGTVTRWWWNLGDGTIFTGAQPAPHIYPAPGVYPVKFVIEDNSGCISDTMKTNVTIGSYPFINFDPPNLCLGSNMLLHDSSTAVVGIINDWKWQWPDGSISTGNPVGAPFVATGDYEVGLTATTALGCSSFGNKTIHVAPTPTIEATTKNVCLGEPSVFTGTNLTTDINIDSWLWEFGDSNTGPYQNTSTMYLAAGDYNVTLHAVSDEGCIARPVELTTSVLSVKSEAGADTIIAIGQPLQLNSHAPNVASVQYTWSPATGLNNPYIANPIAVLGQDQTYQLLVTSPEGCKDVSDIHIKVYQGPEFYVPTGFSPNNDGRHDVLRIIAAGIPSLDFFTIWNRWGQQVFTTNDLSVYWDGTLKGTPAEVGAYVWMIQGVDYNGRRFSRRGTVTLIR